MDVGVDSGQAVVEDIDWVADGSMGLASFAVWHGSQYVGSVGGHWMYE